MELAPYEKRLELMRGLMWDYTIPPVHCLEVLEGTRERAGHYTEKTLFRKLLESYRWFYEQTANKIRGILRNQFNSSDDEVILYQDFIRVWVLGKGKTPIEEARPKLLG